MRLLVMPHSEVCMHMKIAGKEMYGEQVGSHMVQLYELDQTTKFSFPITEGEAGWFIQESLAGERDISVPRRIP